MTKKELTMRELKGEARFCCDCKWMILKRHQQAGVSMLPWVAHKKLPICNHPVTRGLVTGQPLLACNIMRADGNTIMGSVASHVIERDSLNMGQFKDCGPDAQLWRPKDAS